MEHCSFIVFVVGEYVSNVHLTPIEMHRGDQTILVAANIEHNQVAHFICAGKRLTEFVETIVVGFINDSKPAGKCALAIGVFFPELAQCLSADHVHSSIISQIEIFDKMSSLSDRGCCKKRWRAKAMG